MKARKLDKQRKRTLVDARNMIAALEKADGNEAETRRRVERIFERIMRYDTLAHLSRERAIRGAGETEHVDFAVQIEPGENASPVIMVELKRIGLELAPKHLKQVSSYAINAGCQWILLTNGRDWRLYHVEFGQPPVTKIVDQWNILDDDIEVLASKFDLISYKRVRRGGLDNLWKRTKVLAPRKLLQAVLSVECMRSLRRVLKRDSGVAVTADDIVGALRKMLNQNAASILEDVEVSLPQSDAAKTRRNSTKPRAQRSRVSISDLLQAELLRPSSTLFVDYKGSRYESIIREDGAIEFEGNKYSSPSLAGGAVTSKHGVHAPNGWRFWQFNDPDGAPKQLDELRKQFLAMNK